MEETLEQLVDRAKGGSKDAFSDIVKMTQQKLLSYAYPMLGSVQDAEDTVQEVYVRAYQHLDKYRQNISFAAWLYTICYRLCMNRLKRRSSLLQLLPKLRNEAAAAADAQMNDGPMEDELSILDSLSAEDRNLVVLRVIHEQSYAEISRITGRREESLRKRYERVRKRLQEMHEYAQPSKTTESYEFQRRIAAYDKS